MLSKHLRDAGLAKGAALISELCIADFGRRADLVLANGKLSAFEIKSDIDDLSRLDGQIETFVKYFESVTIVCAPRHTAKVLTRVPSTVGVWEVTNAALVEVQDAGTNEITDKAVWLSYLPVTELRGVLKQHAIRPIGLRPDLIEQAQQISVSDLRSYVLSYFKRRKKVIAKRADQRSVRPIAESPIETHRRKVDMFIAGCGFVPGTPAIPRRT
ncbi:sce7726 family protein [Burkholderia multivorans]|uniref:sce7726 family protein n=1 Tax=Burkholderia multivorans TaxID=87883 RepID=UPI0015617B17|nr:sce7726 family protein [Burkholderia multivorans]MBH9664926.1 sce7726 family protein [Burkholderia multivorans]MBU9185386.1 sce7726 family protein [Burkholderia multivorans]MBU9241769.1 sce7726 family protein [Burkholderia multivorans]MCL4660153.1 sce7726 family protein [Burkholderia multivorans]MCO1344283.1 sce7726 family protein [Burkholderia multivorans]